MAHSYGAGGVTTNHAKVEGTLKRDQKGSRTARLKT